MTYASEVESTASATSEASAVGLGNGERPGLIEQQRERKQHQRRGAELAGRRDGRIDAAKTTPEHRRYSIEEGGEEHRSRGRQIVRQAA